MDHNHSSNPPGRLDSESSGREPLPLSHRRADEIFIALFPQLQENLQHARGGPFAAAVVRDGEVLATGVNTVLADHDPTRHAEMNALSAAGRAVGHPSLQGCILLTTHLPCLMCLHALKWAGIATAHYLFDYDETERLFGFHGDSRLLSELGLSLKNLLARPGISLIRHDSPEVTALYRERLVRDWHAEYAAQCSGYDV